MARSDRRAAWRRNRLVGDELAAEEWAVLVEAYEVLGLALDALAVHAEERFGAADAAEEQIGSKTAAGRLVPWQLTRQSAQVRTEGRRRGWRRRRGRSGPFQGAGDATGT